MNRGRRTARRGAAGSGAPAGLAPGAQTLAAAVQAVARVAHGGQSADEALAAAESRPDRAAVRAIALGTLRWYLRLGPAVVQLLDRSPESMPVELRSLLVAAVHQIEYSRGAPEVAVHLAVDASRALGQARASGFVNAVLRRYLRERERLLAETDAEPAMRTAHPQWFARALAEAWPEDATAVLEANNLHPPMTLRVDTRRVTRDDYLAQLAAQGRAAQAVPAFPQAVTLEHPCPVTQLPGFDEGLVSVQDAGAQLAAPLLDAQPGERVLDACAAPGGKTGHILERTPGLAALVAVDLDAQRLDRVRANLGRLGWPEHVRLIAGDLADPATLAHEAPFERILLDAPCSSTGVIRRHPDIKLLRRASDIPTLAQLQQRLLAGLFERLAPGGRLVYCTCSVLPAENERVVESFLAGEPRARLLPWPATVELPPNAHARPAGVQLLPGPRAATDGFYYACLTRA